MEKHVAELNSAIDDIVSRVQELENDSPGEADLSVNDWIKRIQDEAKASQGYARTAEVELEARAWIEMAAIATRRAAQVRERA